MKLKLTLKPPFILYNDNDTLCECGEHKKCVRKINASDNGRLWVENKDHFRCGKIRNKIMNYSARGCMYCEGICNKECIPKQETTPEEIAEYLGFVKGVKWQQEQEQDKKKYSEEETEELITKAIKRTAQYSNINKLYGDTIEQFSKEWFNENKKK